MKRLATRGVWLLAVLTLALTGCPKNHGGNYDGGPRDGGGGSDGGGSGSGRRLAVVGPPLVQLQTGETAQLRVALVQENVGAVAGETVSFELVGAGAGSVLAGAALSGTGVTDAQGFAGIDITAGTTETTFQVTANAPGANPVAFGIQVIRLQHVIQIARTPSVRVAPNGTSATVDTTAFTRVLLRVRVTDQFGNALPDLPIYYTFQTSPRSAAFLDAATTPTTGAGGEAQMTLETGTDLSDTFTVTARSDASATATWNVSLSEGSIKLCETTFDCPQGQFCDNGVCQGVPGCDPANGIDCPVGYRCEVNNECVPVFNTGCTTDADCGNGYSCDPGSGSCTADNPVCTDASDCPQGFLCSGGACEPPSGNLPDISGGWYTAHTFHIGDAIPFLADIAGPIRTIDRILLGDFGLPGFIEDIVASIVDQYIPDWVVDVIHVLDIIATLLQELRSRGYMTVTQNGAAWTATEVWDSFVFYDLTLCSTIPADPTPPCARVDLFVNDPGVPADLGLRVHPFNGTVSETLVVVNTREIEMRVAALIGWLVDTLIDLFTPYDSLADALVEIVDCVAISDFVEGIIGLNVEGICNAVVSTAAQEVTNRLYGLAFDLGILEVNGEASITLQGGGSSYAEELGTAAFEQNDDGWYDGTFLTSFLSDISGAWRASRRPIP